MRAAGMRRPNPRHPRFTALVIGAVILTCCLYYGMLGSHLLSQETGSNALQGLVEPTDVGSNVVGPNFPEGQLKNPNPLHTFTIPRQKSCTSGFQGRYQNVTSGIVQIVLAGGGSTARQELVRAHLRQSLYRARYAPQCVHALPGREELLLEALQTVRRFHDDALVVVLAEAAALFVLPPSDLVERFLASRKRLLMAGSGDCDFCYCRPESELPLRMLNASLAETGSSVPQFMAAVSPFADASFLIGYKLEVLELMTRARSMEQEICVEERLARSLLSMQVEGRPVGIDLLSAVAGAVSAADGSPGPSERWRRGSEAGDSSAAMLAYRSTPPSLLAQEVVPRFPYPPVVLFSGILGEVGRCGCAGPSLQLYNDVCRVAMSNAMAPHLLTPFRELLIGIGSGKRKRFGGYQRPRIVVSLTSIPGRLEGVADTLRSLLTQDLPPDAVYLHAPAVHSVRFGNTSAAVPESVAELARRYSRLVINRDCPDYGPATKLIPTLELETDPSTVIITVDDDMVFKPSAVRRLVRSHFNSPDTAFANAGQVIDFASDGPVSSLGISVRSADMWQDGEYPVDILEAFMGAVYRRDFFDLSALRQIPPECRHTDDIWVSGNLALRGIPRVKLLLDGDSRPAFSKNDRVNALRKSNAPQACGSDCGGQNTPAANAETAAIAPNGNDICASHLLLSHFFRDSGRLRGQRLAERGGDPMGSLVAPDAGAGIIRAEKRHVVCPFEYSALPPPPPDASCPALPAARAEVAEARRRIARAVLDSATDPVQLSRLGALAVEAFHSRCFPGPPNPAAHRLRQLRPPPRGAE